MLTPPTYRLVSVPMRKHPHVRKARASPPTSSAEPPMPGQEPSALDPRSSVVPDLALTLATLALTPPNASQGQPEALAASARSVTSPNPPPRQPVTATLSHFAPTCHTSHSCQVTSPEKMTWHTESATHKNPHILTSSHIHPHVGAYAHPTYMSDNTHITPHYPTRTPKTHTYPHHRTYTHM